MKAGQTAREQRTIGDAEVVWTYGNPVEEYEAIRMGAALIDLRCCALISVSGANAAIELGALFTRELEYLSFETSAMGLFLAEDGSIVDISTVYRTEDGFLVEPSVGNGATTLAYLTRHLADAGVSVESKADDLQLVSIEGPRTWSVAESILEVPVAGLPFQGVRPTMFSGRGLLAARTGWTGEFGLKFFLPADLLDKFWNAALDHCTEVGHWALELAMLEVRQPIFHREVDDDPTVLVAGYNWMVDLDKEEFMGREAVESEDTESSRRTVCFTTQEDDVEVGSIIETTDREVGAVVFAEWNPVTERTIGIARLDGEIAMSGLRLGLRRGDELVPLATVSSPMTVPTSWGMLGGE